MIVGKDAPVGVAARVTPPPETEILPDMLDITPCRVAPPVMVKIKVPKANVPV